MKFPHRTTYIQSASWLFVVLFIIIITGCITVGPDYVRPEVPVYKDWHTQLNGDLNTKEMDVQTLAAWWTTLNDPKYPA